MATRAKSTYIISTIGRSPVIAAPAASPTNALSEMGVPRTRRAPKRSTRPRDDLEHPAEQVHVLADQEHALVARHLLVHGLVDGRLVPDLSHSSHPCPVRLGLGVRPGAARAELHGPVQPLAHHLLQGFQVRPGDLPLPQEPLGEEVHRVPRVPQLPLPRRALVGDDAAVRLHPVGLALQQAGALAPAQGCHGGLRRRRTPPPRRCRPPFRPAPRTPGPARPRPGPP